MEIKERYFEEYELGRVRKSIGRTITETDIVVHAGHTGDFFPHHMDAVFAERLGFGGRIAHGTLVLSIAVGMTADEINPLSFSYGYDRVRFIKPVLIGDTICVTSTLTERRENGKRPGTGFLVERVEVFNQRDEIVLVCDHIYLVERRRPAELEAGP